MNFSSPRQKLLHEIKEAIDKELDSKLCSSCYAHFVCGSTIEQQWIKVTDRLPDTHGNYMVYIEGYVSISAYAQTHDGLVWFDPDGYEIDPHTEGITHWMPLPSPPIQQQENTNEQL